MKISSLSQRHLILGVVALLLGSVAVVEAAKKSAKRSKQADAQVVDMFDAIESGDIEVKVIAKDAKTGNVLIKNKSKKPLAIKLPEAFVGVPVAAQFGGVGGMGGMGMGGMGGGMGGMGGGMGGNQAMGGGMMGGMGGGMGGGMMGGGGMGGMGGGGFFKVEPEKVGKLKMVTMCLEHGKKDPSPHVAYELKPVEFFTSDPKVIELVKMLARGEVDQRSAQAAAWHLASGMSWEELANKIGAKHLNGTTEPFFTAEQIRRGMVIAAQAERLAAENHQKPRASQATSLSSNQ